jgi:hypothetical protein
MGYIALVDNRELELRDENAVRESFRGGEITLETWIKIEDVESDWETLEEMFPDLAREK